MDKWMLVLLESSVALLLFYGVYAVWLKKETFFSENRFYLLFAAWVSLLLPWINFTFPEPAAETITVYNLLEPILISANGYEQSVLEQLAAWQWVLFIYLSGVSLSLILLLIKTMHLVWIGINSEPLNKPGIPPHVRLIRAKVAPFSFLNTIYINPEQITPEQIHDIVLHERVHVNQWHTYDCLFYELLIVLFWFHPIVYRYRKSAKELHEFLADQGAIRSGISEEQYQKLLFEQASGIQFVALANSFNYSLIKRRLIMLTKMKSPKWAKIRILYVVPALLVFVLVFACKQNQPDEAVADVVEAKVNENTADIDQASISEQEADRQKAGDEKVYLTVDQMPVYPGGDEALRRFIAQNVKYPEKAKQTGTEGKIYVAFVVNSQGLVENVRYTATRVPVREKNEVGEIAVVAYTEVFHKEGKAFDALIEEAIRVVSSQPEWEPGLMDGKPVNVEYTIPINFLLENK